MRVSIRATGIDEALRALDVFDTRLSGAEPITPLLRIIAEDWASTAQQRILKEEISLPELAPATHAIRKKYGHDGKPKLVRGGELVHSIAPLEVSETGFVVGTEMSYASVLFTGGKVTDKRGRTHEVQAFPFLEATQQMIDDAVEMATDFFMGGARSV